MSYSLLTIAKYVFNLSFIIGIILIGNIGCSCFKKNFDNIAFYGTNITPDQERTLLAQNTYQFGFDRFEINNKDDLLSIYAHAKKINHSHRARVRLEGHTDDRGSREYNIALGERRAKAVADLLFLKGVDLSKMTIVSYGKEKPISKEQNENAWQKNRRTVIVYENY